MGGFHLSSGSWTSRRKLSEIGKIGFEGSVTGPEKGGGTEVCSHRTDKGFPSVGGRGGVKTGKTKNLKTEGGAFCYFCGKMASEGSLVKSYAGTMK